MQIGAKMKKTYNKHGKGNLDQSLECAAPKHYSKYTTLLQFLSSLLTIDKVDIANF